jgi:hypothetical protein
MMGLSHGQIYMPHVNYKPFSTGHMFILVKQRALDENLEDLPLILSEVSFPIQITPVLLEPTPA